MLMMNCPKVMLTKNRPKAVLINKYSKVMLGIICKLLGILPSRS
jgi:hypothetical protein